MSGAVDLIKREVAAVRDRFIRVACDKNMVFEREAGFAIQAIIGSEYALKIATANRESMISAVVNVAAIGISLNPARKQAYLVPRDGRICLDISYMGLLDIAIQSGSIRWGQADIVRQRDTFALNDVDKPPTHTRDPFSKDRGDMVGAYVVVKTADGDFLTTAMSADEIFDIRNRSSAWKAWMEKKKKCPWVTDEGEMSKKTVIKRAYKLWPKTERLDTAVHYLNTDGGEGLAEESSGGLRIKATDGAIHRIDADQLARVTEVANKVRRGYGNLGAEAAADYIAEQNFDADETVALWALFETESKMRADIKATQRAFTEVSA